MINNRRKIDRREFIRESAVAAAALSGAAAARRVWAAPKRRWAGKKVIVIGIDGMDPNLTERLMAAGQLPNFAKLSQAGGFSRLGTTIPPQSPVAWASFINGAGPGSHGIFDFIHRDPEKQCYPFFSGSRTMPAEGGWEVGDHRLQLSFWPFNHQAAQTLLGREGIPFWDYLDEAGIESVFYDLPSNYPPSESRHGHHRCLAGMGTPDMLGTYGTYQHFAEDGPFRTKEEGGGKRSCLFFEENETAEGEISGPKNDFLKKAKDTKIKFLVHRDLKSRAAAIDIQEHRILLKEGQWSAWIKLDFEMSMPSFLPNEHLSGICRFYLQELEPNLRLYVSPINFDPSDSASKVTEPDKFIKEISQDLGLFSTLGFQEDHKALSNGVFNDEEFARQADYVLEERLRLLDYALKNYDDGLLFFYFSSTDLQAHMFWWDSEEKHPVRSASAVKECFEHLKGIYRRMDEVLGEMLTRYGEEALVMVLSDHGFANFGRQFGVNRWLRDNGYVQPGTCGGILADVDWSKTRAYGLGINGIYINLRGRERDGIVAPGAQREELIEELVAKLEAVRDGDRPVIRNAYRSDQVYAGPATALAPDIVLGFYRGYRASWTTCLGDVDDVVLKDNDSAWSADHCADALEVPGVLFCNRPIKHESPGLWDLAPTILAEFGLSRPPAMTGRNVFASAT